jgi:hypothetical protein
LRLDYLLERIVDLSAVNSNFKTLAIPSFCFLLAGYRTLNIASLFDQIAHFDARYIYTICAFSSRTRSSGGHYALPTRSMYRSGRFPVWAQERVAGLAIPTTRSFNQECRLGTSRSASLCWSQSSTSASTHPTRAGPRWTRLGNCPARSNRATCCGEYRTNSFS